MTVIIAPCEHLRASEARFERSHEVKINFSLTYRTVFFKTSFAKLAFVHARIKKHALNWAFHRSCEKIVFDTRVRKWFYPRVAFSPSLRSSVNVHTRIKPLFRIFIENNYFDTTCTKLDLANAFLFKHVRNRVLRTECQQIYIVF